MTGIQVYDGAGESEFPLLPGFTPVLLFYSDFSVPFQTYMMQDTDLAKFQGKIPLEKLKNFSGARIDSPALQMEVTLMDKSGSLLTACEVLRLDDAERIPRFFADRIE